MRAADLTCREFEEIYGGKPPAKLLFWFRGAELYHREVDGWHRYADAGLDSRVSPAFNSSS